MTLEETVQALTDKGSECPECGGGGYWEVSCESMGTSQQVCADCIADGRYGTGHFYKVTCPVCSGYGHIPDAFTKAVIAALQEVPF